MKWNMMLGMIVAVGALAATGARAQETAQSTQAKAPEQSATAHHDDYGSYVDGPATVDADGVPVAKPNPMSRFLKQSRKFGDIPIDQPLVDDHRTDGSATDGQTK
jgi:hypothetical protein